MKYILIKSSIMYVSVYAKSFQLCHFVTPWIVAHQAPLSMGFSRQEYWSGLPGPSPGDLPQGLNPHLIMSPALQTSSLPLAPPGKHMKWLFL